MVGSPTLTGSIIRTAASPSPAVDSAGENAVERTVKIFIGMEEGARTVVIAFPA